MPAERLLGTLLRSFQTHTDQQDTARLLGTAASLLTSLNNPLNVTLLTSQLLSAPAIWTKPEGLQTCMRCLSVFHSAAQALIRHEKELNERASKLEPSQPQLERALPKDDWIRAVINGADDHSPRWRHSLVIAGLLLGFGSPDDGNISRSMRNTLKNGLVTAVNASLDECPEDDELGQQTITLVLNHCFASLSGYERFKINYRVLLPIMMRAILHSPEGLRSGYFLGALDLDVQSGSNAPLSWSDHSASYDMIQSMIASPLVASLGPLASLIGYTLEHTGEKWLVTSVVDDLEGFSRTLHTAWRQNKLAGVDTTQQKLQLDEATLSVTLPALWKLLQSTLFATVIILRSALGRVIGDGALGNHKVAPKIATQTLNILRNLYFITARQGQATFSQYGFVNYTALDILGAYPAQVQLFLRQIKPADSSDGIPAHPLDRNLDLFFLNTAEHFTLILPPEVSDELLVPVVTTYLAAGGREHLLAVFEAAHSVTLALFSAPQNAAATLRHLPFYVESLFRAFPKNLSARQFRLAFKTLLRITSPPAPMATSQPMLPATLLELLQERAHHASTAPIPAQQQQPQPQRPGADDDTAAADIPLSEQAVITLTVLDSLSQISLDLLDEWLPLAADMVHAVAARALRTHCKEHFWHMLTGGDMDPERSRVCHAWWSTGGGREWVLYGRRNDVAAVMSGGLAAEGEEWGSSSSSSKL